MKSTAKNPIVRKKTKAQNLSDLLSASINLAEELKVETGAMKDKINLLLRNSFDPQQVEDIVTRVFDSSTHPSVFALYLQENPINSDPDIIKAQENEHLKRELEQTWALFSVTLVSVFGEEAAQHLFSLMSNPESYEDNLLAFLNDFYGIGKEDDDEPQDELEEEPEEPSEREEEEEEEDEA